MADNLTYSNVVEHLIADIPELNDAYAKLLQRWDPDTPAPYIVYGDLFVDYVVDLSEETGTPKESAALTRAMIHLEKLSAHVEWDVRCLSQIGVLEQLFGTEGRMESAAPFMGPATRLLAVEYAEEYLRMRKCDWLKRLPPAHWVSD